MLQISRLSHRDPALSVMGRSARQIVEGAARGGCVWAPQMHGAAVDLRKVLLSEQFFFDCVHLCRGGSGRSRGAVTNLKEIEVENKEDVEDNVIRRQTQEESPRRRRCKLRVCCSPPRWEYFGARHRHRHKPPRELRLTVVLYDAGSPALHYRDVRQRRFETPYAEPLPAQLRNTLPHLPNGKEQSEAHQLRSKMRRTP